MATSSDGRAPSKRNRQRLETRKRLFELCLEEFQRVGVAGTSVRRIADRAGIVPGTFYFHYPGKEHVLLELGRRSIRHALETLRSGKGASLPLRQLLRELPKALEEAERELGDSSLLRAALRVYQYPPHDAEFQPDALLLALVDAIEESRSNGEFASDLSSEEVAQMVWLLTLGCFTSSPHDAPHDPAARSRRFLSALSQALHLR